MAYDERLNGVHRRGATRRQQEGNRSRGDARQQHAHALMKSLPKNASKLQGSHLTQKPHVKGDVPQKTALAVKTNQLNNKQISSQPQHDGQLKFVEAKVRAHQLNQLTSTTKSAPIKEGNTPQILTSNQVTKPLTNEPSTQIRANILNSVATRTPQEAQNPKVVIHQLNSLLKGKKVDSTKPDAKEGKDSNPNALAQRLEPKSYPETQKDVSKFITNGGIAVAKDSGRKEEPKKLDGVHKDSTVALAKGTDGKTPVARKEGLSSETGSGNGSDLENRANEKIAQKNFVWKVLSGVGEKASAGLAAVAKRLSGIISGGVNVVRTVALRFLPYKGEHGFGVGVRERGLEGVRYSDMLARPSNDDIDGGING